MLPEWLPTTLIDGFGTVFVVVVAGWAVISGRLVPRSTLEFTRALYETRLASVEHEKDEWKSAAQTRQAQLDTLMPALSALREGQQTILAFIEAMPKDGDR